MCKLHTGITQSQDLTWHRGSSSPSCATMSSWCRHIICIPYLWFLQSVGTYSTIENSVAEPNLIIFRCHYMYYPVTVARANSSVTLYSKRKLTILAQIPTACLATKQIIFIWLGQAMARKSASSLINFYSCLKIREITNYVAWERLKQQGLFYPEEQSVKGNPIQIF